MNQKPYHIQQAIQLLETGECHLPVDWSDIAKGVSQSPSFAQALKSMRKGRPAMMHMLTETVAINLCKDADDGL